MEEIKLDKIRQLFKYTFAVDNEGLLSFDLSKIQTDEYSNAEIALAHGILAMERIKEVDELFKSKVVFLLAAHECCSFIDVYYIGIARLIFIIHRSEDFYTYMYEEDLDRKVSEKKDFTVDLSYVLTNSNNDAYGNQIL